MSDFKGNIPFQTDLNPLMDLLKGNKNCMISSYYRLTILYKFDIRCSCGMIKQLLNNYVKLTAIFLCDCVICLNWADFLTSSSEKLN